MLLSVSLAVRALGVDDAGNRLDAAAERWVKRALAAMTLDQKVGQLLMPSFESMFIASDSDQFERLASLAREHHVGGFIIFGGSQSVPSVLLNPAYASVTLGQPLEAASTLNRLQAVASLPLLNAADFEAGVGFRIAGATLFPRAMAFGAAGDERLAFEAGRITGLEARALGVHINFAPVVDVNNNPRNPVINTRSFGEDPARVGELAASYVRGLREGGVLATLKHFPGHGDTDVDSHLGLPVINHPRERLDQVELSPFKTGIAAGADLVMTGHIEVPAIDATAGLPTTLSAPGVTGLLRRDLGFAGLICTDSMTMQGVTKGFSPGEAAVRAVKAGNDLVLQSADDLAALSAIKSAVERGEIDRARIDASVERIVRTKAKLGLHRARLVSLDALPTVVGSRAHAALADEVSQRSMTLVVDKTNAIPLSAPADAQLLVLSVVDHPAWGIAAPSRTFLPELKKRWPNATAVEISDRTTASELDLVRAMAARHDAVVAAVYVRASSGSGRMDLGEGPARLLGDVARGAASRKVPFVTVVFGNPYTAMFMPEAPTVLLTYDLYDRAERSAVRAISGEAAVTGRLPIALPGLYPMGHGLERAATVAPRP